MRTLIFTLFTALLLTFFSACSLSKDIPVPLSTTPEVFRNAAAADTSGIAAIEWKQFFTNNGLQQLLDSAIANNYDLQLALKNIDAARLVLSQTKLGYLPEVKLQASAAINRPSENSLNGLSIRQFLGKSYLEDYSTAVTFSWEADIWGKIKNQKAKALAAYLQTAEARKAVQTDLVSLVAKSYYQLLMLDAQVAIAEKNLLLNDSTLMIIRLQYQAGQVTALAVQQAEAQRLAAAQLIPQLEEEITIKENALSILTAVAPAAIKRDGSINEPAFRDKLSAGTPSALLRNRPDIRAQELELAIANANTAIVKANLLPSLSITATGGVNALLASNWFTIPASLFATAIGGITQPVFQRKQLRTQYELSKLDRERSVIEFRQSVLQAVGEVSDALVKVEKLNEQGSIAENRVAILQNAIHHADLLFKNGMANYLEVLTAQSNVLQSELELAALKNEQQVAGVELYRSLGGGWK